MYAKGADLSQMRYADTMQPNPLYRGSPDGRGLIDIDSETYRNPQFTQTMNTPWGQMDPNQFYRQRDAFIQTANEQAGRSMEGAGTSESPGAAPQFNANDMWRQAGNMVDRGWQNPYQNVPIPSTFRPGMAQPSQPPSQGTPYSHGSQTMLPSPPPPSGGVRAWDDPSNPRGQNYNPSAPSGDAPSYPGSGLPFRPGSAMARPAAPQGYAPRSYGAQQPHGRTQQQAGVQGAYSPSTASPYAARRPSAQAQTAWRQQHAAGVASPGNQSWLRGMTPANRQIYGLMQRTY